MLPRVLDERWVGRRVVCAPDKLRDAATAQEAAEALALGARQAGWQADVLPVADGGEGTLEVVLAHVGGAVHEMDGLDGLGRQHPTRFAILPDSTGVVVAADVVGLEPLAPEDRDAMRASSRGLAVPVLAALAAGASRLVVFVGGTANMDGGLGFLIGLGASAYDSAGHPLQGTGEDLTRLASFDMTPALAAVKGVDIVLASDVDSPLIGPAGAAHVFGPQKGATAEQVVLLDSALRRLAERIELDPLTPGTGAAGGLGYALTALGARRVSGAALVLEWSGMAAKLREADLCLTAEGKVDSSSSAGKTVGAVIRACREAGAPCVVMGGEVTPEADELYATGAAAVVSISRGVRSLPDALGSALTDLSAAARSACELAGAVMDRQS